MEANQRIVTELALNVKQLQDGLSLGIREIGKAASSIAQSAQKIQDAFIASQAKSTAAIAKTNAESIKQQRVLVQSSSIAKNASAGFASAISKQSESISGFTKVQDNLRAFAQKLASQYKASEQIIINAAQESAKRQELYNNAILASLSNVQKAKAEAAKAELSLAQAQEKASRNSLVPASPGSYRALSEATGQLAKQLKNLPNAFDATTGAINRNNPAAVALQQQILRNTVALRQADGQLGINSRSLESYGTSLKAGVRSAAMFAASVIGISSAVDALKQGVTLVDQIQRQNIALRNASSSTKEYNQNLSLASNLALSTGTSLADTTDALRRFTGATRGTSIEGDKARQIFKAFTNSFAANGASAEELARAMKALSDMMSKGTVQAEELKGQLGDAMPGALKLFADSLGVSTVELMKMMQNGEVLAADILPKVAAQLEKTTGDKAQQNLRTISGSWEVVKTQVSLLLAEFNKTGAISNFFSKLNQGIAKALEGFKAVYRQAGLSGILGGVGRGLMDAMTFDAFNFRTGYLDNIKSRDTQQQKLNAFASSSPEQQATQISAQTKAIEMQRKKVANLEATVATLSKSYKETWTDGGNSYRQWETSITNARHQLNQAKKTLSDYNNGLTLQLQLQKESAQVRKLPAVNKNTPDDLVSSIRTQISAIPEYSIAENGKAKLDKAGMKALRESRDELLKLIATATNTDVARLKLLKLRDALDELISGRSKNANTSGVSAVKTILNDSIQAQQMLNRLRGESQADDSLRAKLNAIETKAYNDQLTIIRMQIDEKTKADLLDASRTAAEKERIKLLEKEVKLIQTSHQSAYGSNMLSTNKKVLGGEFGRVIGNSIEGVDRKNESYTKLNKALEEFDKQIKAINEQFKESIGPMGIILEGLGVKFEGLKEKARIGFAALGAVGNTVLYGLADGFEELLNSGKLSFKGLVKSLGELIKKLIAFAAVAGLISLIPGVGNFMQIFGSLAGFNVGKDPVKPTLANISMLAQGGIATRATLGVFGEAGPEAIIPLSKLNNFMGQGFGGPHTIVTEVKMDSRVVTTAVHHVEYADRRIK